MTQSTQNYLKSIRDTLVAVLNLRWQPSPLVERQVHPEVEFQDNSKLLLDSVKIHKSPEEYCLIESSINSVRISLCIKKSAEIEVLLTKLLERFMTLRADKFEILRKKAAHPGYDFSFLIWDDHLTRFKKEELINFILEFIQGLEREISEMKLLVINNCRMAATFYANALANNKIE